MPCHPSGIDDDDDDDDGDDDDGDDDDAAMKVQTIICFVTKFYLCRDIHGSSSIPPLLIILKTTKPYQIWYTPLHVGVGGINRREFQRNHIKCSLACDIFLLDLYTTTPHCRYIMIYFCDSSSPHDHM